MIITAIVPLGSKEALFSEVKEGLKRAGYKNVKLWLERHNFSRRQLDYCLERLISPRFGTTPASHKRILLQIQIDTGVELGGANVLKKEDITLMIRQKEAELKLLRRFLLQSSGVCRMGGMSKTPVKTGGI